MTNVCFRPIPANSRVVRLRSIADTPPDSHVPTMLHRYRLLLVPLTLGLGWLIGHLTKGESVALQTASFVLGGLAVLALAGVAFGVRSARAKEARRKDQEDIFLNH